MSDLFEKYGVRTYKQLKEDVDKIWKDWLRKRRIGKVQYVPSNNTIRLYVYSKTSYYEIDLDRCTTERQFIDWLFHLHDKVWFTGEIVGDFLTVFANATRERYGKDPRYYLRGKKQSMNT